MSAVAAATVSINVEANCEHPQCGIFAQRLFEQLSTPHYSTGASVMECPTTLEEWQAAHRTARKRAWRAERLGYVFAEVDNSQHSADIHSINVSLPIRQGRPMSDGYLQPRRHGRLSDEQTRCPRHRTHTYGVLSGRTLVAYMTLHRAGDLAMISMILGHGEHLHNDVMYLLFAGMVDHQADRGGVIFYNRWDSGTEGLRYFKARVGFAAADLEWSLS